MVEVEFKGTFLNKDTARDGDIAEIMGEGQWDELVFQGKTKKVFNIPVRVGSEELTYSPSLSAGKSINEAWGLESRNWIGKKLQIFMVQGKMLIKPIELIKPIDKITVV